ncbi:MAG: hypothetical protein [Olavius algarvensis Gamma 1 endosymbiont]|nr:MAG: hypothetical protein [Olavius algarvensis Gamma 1 endosymbiont]
MGRVVREANWCTIDLDTKVGRVFLQVQRESAIIARYVDVYREAGFPSSGRSLNSGRFGAIVPT